jgi:predicted transcriptional regulator
MAQSDTGKFESSDAFPGHEDAAILAAIDSGLRDASAGRTVPAEEVRRRFQHWLAG